MSLKKMVHSDDVIDGAGHYKDYPEDTARLVAMLRDAGYDVSPQDAALAWHHAGEETHCAGWLIFDGVPLWQLPAMLGYLRPADDDFDTLRSDLARITAERDAAVSGQNEAMALVIGLEGTVHRLTEELRAARVDVGIVGLQSDGYRRERDALQARVQAPSLTSGWGCGDA